MKIINEAYENENEAIINENNENHSNEKSKIIMWKKQ